MSSTVQDIPRRPSAQDGQPRPPIWAAMPMASHCETRTVEANQPSSTWQAGVGEAGSRKGSSAMQTRTLIAVAATALLASSASPAMTRTTPSARVPPAMSGCTIAVPGQRATVEARMTNASDFCDLISRALAQAVFRSPVLVTPRRLWHYAGASVSCRLRYLRTLEQITIRNAARACRWLTRPETRWHREEPEGRASARGPRRSSGAGPRA